MDAAASRLGHVESTIISTRFAARYVETEGIASDSRSVSRGARRTRSVSAAAERADSDERDWTPEELDVFSRHVINLRKGKFSTEGSFSSTSEQVERIFSELIPAYAATQKARGQTPRVMFYAHGGLVEEREGLLPVSAAAASGISTGYTRYCVWETGLRETLTDIIGVATRSSRAARGGLADAAIETLARPGGKPVWGEMKKSAENASETAVARGRPLNWPRSCGRHSTARSSSTRSATAPAPSSTRTSYQSWSRSARPVYRRSACARCTCWRRPSRAISSRRASSR